MVSPTQRSERIRKHKLRTRGKKRKNALENHGTTRSKEELFKVTKTEA